MPHIRVANASHPTLGLIAAVVLGLVGLGAPAEAAAGEVMVVAIPNRAAADFVPTVVAHIIHPLGAQVTLTAGAQAHEAVVTSGLDRAQLKNPANARKVGKLAQASHVLVVESTGAQGRGIAKATLVEVRTGKVLWTQQGRMLGGHLPAKLAQAFAREAAGQLGGGAPGRRAAPATAAPEGDEGWAEGPGKDDAEGAAAGKPSHAAGKAARAGEGGGDGEGGAEPAGDGAADGAAAKPARRAHAKPSKADVAGDEDTTDDGGDGGDGRGEDGREAGEGGEDDAQAEEGEGGGAGRLKGRRPALRFLLGTDAILRNGTLESPASGVTRKSGPRYGGDLTNLTVPFLTLSSNVEFYPLAIHGKGRGIEGLGVYARGTLAYIQNELYIPNQASKDPANRSKNWVSALKLAAAYRLVLGSSQRAPDLALMAGISAMSFSLSKGQFPSVGYTAPLLGARMDLPLLGPKLSLLAFVNLEPLLKASARTKAQLSDQKRQSSGLGFELGGGLRVNYHRVTGALLVRYERIKTVYSGTSNLNDVSPPAQQLINPILLDQYLALFLGLGISI